MEKDVHQCMQNRVSQARARTKTEGAVRIGKLQRLELADDDEQLALDRLPLALTV